MAIFYTRREVGDKVIYTPIGKRAALFGYGWFFVFFAAVLVYFAHSDNPFALVLMLSTLLAMAYIPSFINWVDGLPHWFPVSTARDGTRILRLSWTGQQTIMRKEDEDQYNKVPATSGWLKLLKVCLLIGFGLLFWYWMYHQ
ncbi:MAG: hypothetical protein WA001_05370 [Patescibacteria group bacterium]